MNIDDLTIEQLSLALAKKVGVQDEIEADYEKKIFEDLKGTDGLVQYLKEAGYRDIQRYFGASTPSEQLIIRGSYARTMFLAGKIMTAGQEKESPLAIK